MIKAGLTAQLDRMTGSGRVDSAVLVPWPRERFADENGICQLASDHRSTPLKPSCLLLDEAETDALVDTLLPQHQLGHVLLPRYACA
jgi:hypothetical protein